jgi:hypothetical protein
MKKEEEEMKHETNVKMWETTTMKLELSLGQASRKR